MRKVNVHKLSIIGPSGVGKSTVAEMIRDIIHDVNSDTNAAIIFKLSKPLYGYQYKFYKMLGANLKYDTQDGELLQFLGMKIHSINPDYLTNTFFNEIDNYIEDVNTDFRVSSRIKDVYIINDDCRPHNYEKLKCYGFKFISISGPCRQREDDVTGSDFQHPIEWSGDDRFKLADYVLYNNGDIDDLMLDVKLLVRRHIK